MDEFYVMIIQKGDQIFDQIYNIYDDCSMLCFDDKIGKYYHEDYEEMIKQDYETRSPIFPCRNVSIQFRDYFAIPVSLMHYLKMLSGECKFPFECNIQERIDYDLIANATTTVPINIKEFIESYKNRLKLAL